MLQESQTFLTLSQAVDAIAADFGQYGPQPDLFYKIAPLILGDDFKTAIFNGVECPWIRRNPDQPFTPVNDDALGFYLIHMLETSGKDAPGMARICALVFQTSARPFVVKEKIGVWLGGNMNGFACKRCGNCCQNLGNVLVPEDLLLWTRLGRKDILSWVKEVELDNGKIQYRIWIDPRTGKHAQICPFLAQQPGHATFYCTIQDVKPRVCREYPFTRKHALQTGCLGFDV